MSLTLFGQLDVYRVDVRVFRYREGPMFVPRTEIKRLAADGALDLDGSSGTGEGVMQVFHNPRTTTRKRSNAHPRSDLTFRRASVAGRRVPAVLLGGAFKLSYLPLGGSMLHRQCDKFRQVLIRGKLSSPRCDYFPTRSGVRRPESSTRIFRKRQGKRQRTIAVVCQSSRDTQSSTLAAAAHTSAKPPSNRRRRTTRPQASAYCNARSYRIP